MTIAIITLILAILGLFVLKNMNIIDLKVVCISIAAVLIAATIGICIAAPKMHKPFSINIIEYLIKINDDGSMSTTKKTTQTVIQKQQTDGVKK